MHCNFFLSNLMTSLRVKTFTAPWTGNEKQRCQARWRSTISPLEVPPLRPADLMHLEPCRVKPVLAATMSPSRRMSCQARVPDVTVSLLALDLQLAASNGLMPTTSSLWRYTSTEMGIHAARKILCILLGQTAQEVDGADMVAKYEVACMDIAF